MNIPTTWEYQLNPTFLNALLLLNEAVYLTKHLLPEEGTSRGTIESDQSNLYFRKATLVAVTG